MERECDRLPPATCGRLCGSHVLYDKWLARGGHVPFLVHRVYQLDYSRTDKRFRMLDRLKPREMAERPEGGGGAWPPFVGCSVLHGIVGQGLPLRGCLRRRLGRDMGCIELTFLKGVGSEIERRMNV